MNEHICSSDFFKFRFKKIVLFFEDFSKINRPLMFSCILILSTVLGGSISLNVSASTSAHVNQMAHTNTLHAFLIQQNDHPFKGLLRRSINGGIDWYFTSLALVLTDDQTILANQLYFEQALKWMAPDGPMPTNAQRGLRRISNSQQMWELVALDISLNVWRCAETSFPQGAPVAWVFEDECGRRWRNWGRVNIDAYWSLLDTDDVMLGLRPPDSHDAQAAMFLLALARWLTLSQNWSWLMEPVWQYGHPEKLNKIRVLTRLDIIKKLIRHNILDQMQNGMFRTFRHNRHPSGKIWDVQYLMDNIECLAALEAFIPLFDQAGYSAFSKVLRHYTGALSQSLNNLLSVQEKAPDGYIPWARQGDWPDDHSPLQFYPHLAGQYWLGFFASRWFQTAKKTNFAKYWSYLENQVKPQLLWWKNDPLVADPGWVPYVLARSQQMPCMFEQNSVTLWQWLQQIQAANSLISDFAAARQVEKLWLTRSAQECGH